MAEGALRGKWTLGDALLVLSMFLLGLFVTGLMVAAVGAYFGNRELLSNLYAQMSVQGVAYLFAAACARIVIPLRTGKPLLKSIGWNHVAGERVPQLLLAGLLLAVSATIISSFLDMPDDLPVRKYFATRGLALLSMFFGIVVAPFVEEVFFRGIIFGGLLTTLEEEKQRGWLSLGLAVLAAGAGIAAFRGYGTGYAMFAPLLFGLAFLLAPFRGQHSMLLTPERQVALATAITAVFFSAVHGAQLANRWAPLLMILIVGMVMTMVRVRMNSVASGWWLHLGYNSTLFLMMWASTGGFRNLGR